MRYRALGLLVQRTMAAVAVGRILGLFALAKPHFFFLFKFYNEGLKGHAVNGFMFAVAEWLFFAQSATAPGIVLVFFYRNTGGKRVSAMCFVHMVLFFPKDNT